MFVLRRVILIKRLGTVILNMKISLVFFQDMEMTSLKLQKKRALIRFFLEPLPCMKQLMEHRVELLIKTILVDSWIRQQTCNHYNDFQHSKKAHKQCKRHYITELFKIDW